MRKIIFLLWLCALGALCVKVGDVGFYLLAAALLSALAGLLSNLFTQKSVTAEVFADGFFEKGEKKNITIKISGGAGLCRGALAVKNLLTGEETEKSVEFYSGRRPCEIKLNVESRTCGKLVFGFSGLRAYDFWGLTSKRITGRLNGSVTVVPQPLADNEIFSQTLSESFESDDYSEDKAGSEHTEPIGIREYRQGDSYKSVHWKTSFRLGDIFVREYAEPISDSVCIYIETSSKQTGEVCDRLISKACGLSMRLTEQGIFHYIAFHSFTEEQNVFEEVKDDNSFAVALDKMLSSLPTVGESLFEDFGGLFAEHNVARIYYFSSDDKTPDWQGGELINS